LRIESV
jgi:hypothetical protein